MKVFFTIITFFVSATTFAQNVGIGTPTPTDQLHTTGTVRLQKYAGATTRLLQIDSSGRLIATEAGAVFTNTTPYAITDNGCATGVGVSSSITISGQPNVPIQSSRIAVKVNITHPYVGDLKIYLFPPAINVLTLANGNGGNGDNFTNTIFTDQAVSSISAGSAPFTGQYKPIGGAVACNIPNTGIVDFASIGGGTILPNGTWTLKVFDAANGDVGVLNDWSISFTGPESITTADENNFVPKLVGGNFMASNIYQPAGSSNIGIGTKNPNYLLDINGRARLRHNGASSGMWHNKADNTEGIFTGLFNDSTYGYFGANGWQIGMDITNGMIGIGNLYPKAPLSFPNTTGNKIALWGDPTGGHYGIGIQGSLLQLYTSASNADIAFGYGRSSSFVETMRIKGNGNVGIGTNNPGAKLDVNGTVKITDGNQGDGKILTSDAAGNATWKSLPAASASVDISANNLNSSINLYGDTTTFLYGWNQIVESGGTNFNNTTGIYTVPVSGFYQINASVTWPPFPNVPTGTIMLIVALNTVRLAQTFSVSSTFRHTTIVSCGRRLTAGQTIRIGVFNGSASLLVFNNSIEASFSIALVHP